MSKFVHLHTHSHYSLLDGLGKIDQLLDKCKELGMNGLGLTDHGVMYGAIEFYTKAKAKGIKPIIGCEAYVALRSMADRTPKIDTNPYHLTLLAYNKTGYLNLIKLVTVAHLQGYYYKPRIDKELLKKHSEGLIALSGCLKGELPRMALVGNKEGIKKIAKEYQEIFSGNFYFELMNHPNIPEQDIANKVLIKIGKEVGIPVVATNDIHYINSEDSEAQDVLLCVQTGSLVDQKERMDMRSGDFSMKSPAEMISAFKEVPEAIKNTLKIAEQCNLELDLNKILLPHFEVPEGYDENSFLKELCEEGILKKYGKGETDNKDLKKELKNIKKEVIDRMEYELEVIKKMGFAPYFLIVSDFVNYAKNHEILVGPGRGSAAGSIVSYALNITDIDPLEYGLLFERFLNPERIVMPDIDIDFADNRRGEVIEYVISKYGLDHVAQIITFGTMAARAAVRDVGRVIGIPYLEVDKIAKLIPQKLNLSGAIKMVPELKNLYNTNLKVKKLLDMALKLEGVARHASTHAAGVVISQEPLTNYTPLQKALKGETSIITQYTMYDFEKIGLLKMDLLGLANLSILGDTLEIIEAVHKEKVDLSKIPFDDKKTFELLCKGETTGVFQLESEGMRRYIKQLRPTRFEDLIAMVALYRPGPLGSGMVEDYVKRKNGRASVSYPHPKLESILKETYGIAVYQEQIMEIAKTLAGFSGSEADMLRKAMGKKLPKEMKKQRQLFVDGAVKNNISKDKANKIFDLMEYFAGYGFNKSHATCYAQIAYQTAYLKAHFPSCFMAALMTSDQGDTDKIAFEVAECKRMGIEVLPPDINESFRGFAVVPETSNIRFALGAIKNVGEGAISAIVSERKANGSYKSIEEFLSRVNFSQINRKVLESLIKSGAMDSLGVRESMLLGVDQMLNYSQKTQKNLSNGQVDLFSSEDKNTFLALNLPKVSELDTQQRLSWEKELLGLYISSHPIAEFDQLLSKITIPCNSINGNLTGKIIKIGGIITGIQRILTRKGDLMLFVEVEDTSGNAEILVFPKILEKDPNFWLKNKIVLIEGKVVPNKEGFLKLVCENFEELDKDSVTSTVNQINPENKKSIKIKLPKTADIEIFKKVQKLLEQSKGENEVILEIGSKKIKLPFKVNFSPDLKNKLSTILKI